jgi:WD40 repeat protein
MSRRTSWPRRRAALAFGGFAVVFRLWASAAGPQALGTVLRPEFSCDARQVAFAGCLWDVENGKQLIRLQANPNPSMCAVALSPDGKTVVTGGGWAGVIPPQPSFESQPGLWLWDAATGKALNKFVGHNAPGYVHRVQFSLDGSLIASAATDGTAKVWDTGTGRLLFACDAAFWRIPDLYDFFSHDGSTFMTIVHSRSPQGMVKLWETKTWKLVSTIEGSNMFWWAEFSPDGKKVVTGDASGSVQTWEPTTGRPLLAFVGHSRHVTRAFFTANGRRVVSASVDKTVRLWETDSGRELKRFDHGSDVNQVVANSNGTRLLSQWVSGGKGMTSLWDAETGAELANWEGLTDLVIGFSPDGKTIFLLHGSGRVLRVVDAATGKDTHKFPEPAGLERP